MIERAKNILLSPKREWPVIAEESATTQGIYVPYVLVLAAIGPVFGFIKSSLIGYGAFGIHVRNSIGAGIGQAIVQYILSLVLLFVMALIINALASTFQGEKNQVQALKAACYAWTAAWIAAVAVIIPWIGWLIAILGGIYSIYLLYLGLPETMKCPQDKAVGYTAVSIVIALVLSFVVSMIVGTIFGINALTHGGNGSVTSGSGSSQVSFDKDSRLGKLAAFSKRMQAAGEQMDKAGDSDDPQTRADARKAMVAALSGSKDGKPVEAMATEQLKSFLPETLGDWQRTSLSSEKQANMGIEVTTAKADYQRGDGPKVHVSLADIPAMGGAYGLAQAFAGSSEKQDENGFEKQYNKDGNRYEIKWNKKDQRGRYHVILAGRFQLTVQGHADSMDQLKKLASGIDTRGLQQAARGE